MQTEQKWLSIRQAAAHIGMSVAYLRKAVRLRQIPFTRLGNKTLRFDRGSLDSWMAAQSCGGEVLYDHRPQ